MWAYGLNQFFSLIVIKKAGVIAQAFNPFAWLSGANKPGDILEAAAELAEAIRDVAKQAHYLDQLLKLTKVI